MSTLSRFSGGIMSGVSVNTLTPSIVEATDFTWSRSSMPGIALPSRWDCARTQGLVDEKLTTPHGLPALHPRQGDRAALQQRCGAPCYLQAQAGLATDDSAIAARRPSRCRSAPRSAVNRPVP